MARTDVGNASTIHSCAACEGENGGGVRGGWWWNESGGGNGHLPSKAAAAGGEHPDEGEERQRADALVLAVLPAAERLDLLDGAAGAVVRAEGFDHRVCQHQRGEEGGLQEEAHREAAAAADAIDDGDGDDDADEVADVEEQQRRLERPRRTAAA